MQSSGVDMANQFKHIFITGSAKGHPYAVPSNNRSSKASWEKTRQHGEDLTQRFQLVGASLKEVAERRKEQGFDDVDRSLVTFEVEITEHLNLMSFEDARAGIQLASFCISTKDPTVGIVNVLVPDGKFTKFEGKLRDFLDPAKDTKKGNPKNEDFIKSISDVRRAKLESLWTDSTQDIPEGNELFWWEAWIGSSDSDLTRLRRYARRFGFKVGEQTLKFLDRRVVLLYGTLQQVGDSVELLDVLLELRSAKPVAQEFVEMSASDQNQWCEDLATRILPPDEDAPAVCLLDTGLLATHSLLAGHIDPEADCDTYDPAWGSDDHNGHGTQMAGFCVFGEELDLMLQNTNQIQLRTRVESVKILPRKGENDPQLYGEITQACAAIAEIKNPSRRRVFSMAVTSTASPDGQPDSWSAAIDEHAATEKSLFVLSAGNIYVSDSYSYMTENETSPIESPGQSWNAITVGAYTTRTVIEPADDFPGWKPVSPSGGLGPISRTGFLWDRAWPNKPDVLAEGGNLAWEPRWSTPSDGADSLRLLTTSSDGKLTFSGDTSAAANSVAKLCAEICAEYPEVWAETVRGLTVHSARWTLTMLALRGSNKGEVADFIRVHGFGVPSLERALESRKNSATLIIEDELQPFADGKNGPKLNEMNIHELPWPDEVLMKLGSTKVRMRVTLSYFVEPNPARRGTGYSTKYQYASHGLKFDVKTSLESDVQFRRRISAAEGKGDSSSDSSEWLLGTKARHKGSLHSDIWEGDANKLAGRNHIAVYPTTGWWKTHKSAQKWNSKARYSLIVSLECDESEVEIDGARLTVDLYSAIRQQVAVET